MSHPVCSTHASYLLTCDDFDRLLARAAGQCEVCGVPAADVPRETLRIDHDHARGIGAVRGLVCPSCNGLLGRVDAGGSSPDHLADSVARYLASPFVANAPDARRRQFRVRVIGETISTAMLRASFTDVMHRAIRGRITYITSNGRPVAAIVPLEIAEAGEAALAKPAGEDGDEDRQETPAGE